MSFKKNKYIVIRNAITKDLATFVANYFLMKKQVYDTCLKHRYISPFENMLGFYENKTDQVENTYCAYSDIAMETLMIKCQPEMEKVTGFKLYPAYSYARAYKKGDILKRHTDRFSCEISTTLNLGGDPWPIFLHNGKKDFKVNLKPGDMLIYQGVDLEHWREPFQGDNCAQVFLHYNNVKTENSKENLFDTRPHLGLSSDFKNKNS